MISFSLSEEEQVVLETVRKFASTEIRPVNRDCEEKGAIPDGLSRTYHELGLSTLNLGEGLGGQGLGMTTRAIVEEELAWADGGIAASLDGPGLASFAILELGSPEQRTRFLAPFAEPSASGRLAALAILEGRQGEDYWDIETAARPAGGDFLLSGRKQFVVHGGIADLTVVTALVEGKSGWEGLGAFAVEKGNPGLAIVERTLTSGLNTLHVAEIELKDCRVPAEARLAGGEDPAGAFARAIARANVVSAARATGIARAAVEYAVEYAEQRVAFGKPIAQHQGLGWMLADMATEVDTARWMTWRAAAALDEGKRSAPREAAKALVQANLVAAKVTIDAVQVLGGNGFCRDYPVEKWMRDARTLAFFTGTDQMLNQFVARMIMSKDGKEGAKAA